MIEKKSTRTKNSLLDAMWELILDGDKVISVKTITERANTAYGSFYRYYKNLDQIHKELIQRRVSILAEFGNNELLQIKSPILRIYVGYYLAFDMFKQENVSQWLKQHPVFLNETWEKFSEPTTETFLREALKVKDVPEFSKKNFEHYLRIRGFIFWNYQHIIRLISSGKDLDDIYIDFMCATNLLNLPSEIHHNLVNKSLKIIKDFQLPG
tara:strand:+ start:1186 stop:1818 length:633 start_codon:yes stop_codon:yes gene_type:complete